MSQDTNNDFKADIRQPHTVRSFLAAAILLGALAVSATTAIATTTITAAYAQKAEGMASTVTNGVVAIVGPRTIAPNDFLYVYSSNPYHIMKGSLVMKVPCDDKSTTSLEVFIGSSPNLSATSPQIVKELSTPGKECVFHLNIASHQDSNNPIISDVVVKNTGNSDVKLSDTSSIVLTVTEVMANPQVATGQQQQLTQNTTGSGSNTTTHS
jgi:hypothetical protein